MSNKGAKELVAHRIIHCERDVGFTLERRGDALAGDRDDAGLRIDDPKISAAVAVDIVPRELLAVDVWDADWQIEEPGIGGGFFTDQGRVHRFDRQRGGRIGDALGAGDVIEIDWHRLHGLEGVELQAGLAQNRTPLAVERASRAQDRVLGQEVRVAVELDVEQEGRREQRTERSLAQRHTRAEALAGHFRGEPHERGLSARDPDLRETVALEVDHHSALFDEGLRLEAQTVQEGGRIAELQGQELEAVCETGGLQKHPDSPGSQVRNDEIEESVGVEIERKHITGAVSSDQHRRSHRR